MNNKNGLVGIVGLVSIACAAGLLLVAGCTTNKEKENFVDLGTAPAGGVFNPVGVALAETLNKNKGENKWSVTAKGTKGSQENIRKLTSGEMQLGMSNSAISYFAFKGEGGWDKKHDIRTVVTIAPNVAMFVTKQDSGIKTIADLKGKRVVCGPAGAGFEMFLEPILNAHGVKMADFEVKNNTQNGAVDMLADGQADAAFLGGAVPAGSLQRACNEMDIFFIPFDEEAKKKLVAEYSFFWPVTIPKDKYKDLTEDFQGLNVGSMHVITSANEDDELIYQITKTIWENRQKIGHKAAEKFINEKNAARNTGTPFHPGAIRFYQQAKIWPETSDAK
jgi:TRAP transporter TAXI family solute receptor